MGYQHSLFDAIGIQTVVLGDRVEGERDETIFKNTQVRCGYQNTLQMVPLISEMTCEGRNAIHQRQKQTNKNKDKKTNKTKQIQMPKTRQSSLIFSKRTFSLLTFTFA